MLETVAHRSTKADFDQRTGALFETLWEPYDEEQFEDSVALFRRRLDIIGFDPGYFEGKRCLDAGCGGGRNTIAMARLGATAVGIDIGGRGIEDARHRSAGLSSASFLEASVENLPFEDDSFDVVWCAGVLMHVEDETRALKEMVRVLKPGGLLYMLVYATGGMRWPLVQLLKPLAAQIGRDAIESAIVRSDLSTNKRRTFVDDLFCPKFDFFHWRRLDEMLTQVGLVHIQRWSDKARLDHEQSLADYREDLECLEKLLTGGCHPSFGAAEPLFRIARNLTRSTIEGIAWHEAQVAEGLIDEDIAKLQVIGQGHHRVFATKPLPSPMHAIPETRWAIGG